jgi:hypothetical protein
MSTWEHQAIDQRLHIVAHTLQVADRVCNREHAQKQKTEGEHYRIDVKLGAAFQQGLLQVISTVARDFQQSTSQPSNQLETSATVVSPRSCKERLFVFNLNVRDVNSTALPCAILQSQGSGSRHLEWRSSPFLASYTTIQSPLLLELSSGANMPPQRSTT